jgi:hypothetical protein
MLGDSGEDMNSELIGERHIGRDPEVGRGAESSAEHDHSRSNQPDAATPRGGALAAEERHAPSDCGRERQTQLRLVSDSEERIASVLPFETSAYLEGTA